MNRDDARRWTIRLDYVCNTTETETSPSQRTKLKVEINLNEHGSRFGIITKPYRLSSPLGSGEIDVTTYTPDELLGTKLRALYQRRKGRDLFDLGLALKEGTVDPERLLEAFNHYMIKHGNPPVSRELFKQNLDHKLEDEVFISDFANFVDAKHHPDIAGFGYRVEDELINRLPSKLELKEQRRKERDD